MINKVHKLFSEPFKHGDHDFSISLSVGFARSPEDTTDFLQLEKIADERMYEAKQGKKAGALV